MTGPIPKRKRRTTPCLVHPEKAQFRSRREALQWLHEHSLAHLLWPYHCKGHTQERGCGRWHLSSNPPRKEPERGV